MPLNAKQERFCHEYIIDLNATQAAIRAGYSEKTAQEQSSRLLSNVIIQKKINEAKENRSKSTGITFLFWTLTALLLGNGDLRQRQPCAGMNFSENT
jgi:phage terminase small subunit